MAEQEAVVATGDMTDKVAPQVNSEELEAAKAENAGESADPQESQEEGELDEHGNKRKSGYQRTKEAKERAERERDEERRQKEEERREKLYWRQVALESKGNKPADAEASEPDSFVESDREPLPEDFAFGDGNFDVAKYNKAFWQWGKRQDAREAEARKTKESWNEKISEARKKYPDWDEVMKVPVIPADSDTKRKFIEKAIQTSQMATDVAHYLGKHPDESISLFNQDKEAIKLGLREIVGMLKERFARAEQAEAEEEEKPKTVVPLPTGAPKPGTPIGKTSSVNKVDIHDPKLPYKEFVKARDAQKNRK